MTYINVWIEGEKKSARWKSIESWVIVTQATKGCEYKSIG